MNNYFYIFIKKVIGICPIIFIAFHSSFCFSQEFVNNGDIISNNGDIIFVDGNVTDTSKGLFDNTGSIYLTGDWTNNAGDSAFTTTPGGNVIMSGDTQNIQGSDVTGFYNLILANKGVKHLQHIDAVVNDSLILNHLELSTDSQKLIVTNTSPGVITRTSGFVSSLDTGALVRYTASSSAYLFPVGSSIGIPRYRPVDITPNNPMDTFFVRMANTNATNEFFDLNQRDPLISNINQFYYHRILGKSSAGGEITIYYDTTDGEFTSIAHWQNQPKWENMFAGTAPLKYYFSGALSKSSWNDFSYPAFALINDACGDLFVPTAFSPNGDSYNDVECVYGKCIKSMLFSIYDRWGEKVFETNDQTKCWDGTYKGEPLNPAVFVYTLEASLSTGETKSLKGNIGLVR